MAKFDLKAYARQGAAARVTELNAEDLLLGRVGLGLDAVSRLHQGCGAEGFRLEKDHEANAVLLTPKDVLALGHRVTTEQDGLELTFRDPVFGEAVLGMATHGHISDARDVRPHA